MKNPTGNTRNIEDLKFISISDFKRLNFLKPYTSFRNVNLKWKNKFDEIDNSITIDIEIAQTKGLISLSYVFDKTQKIKYSLPIIAKNSNLNKGLVWFFMCPKTNKVCRKLHFISGYFLHRTSFETIYYKQQLESHKERSIRKFVYDIFLEDEVLSKIEKKYFRCQYNGNFTKKFLKILQVLEYKETLIEINL